MRQIEVLVEEPSAKAALEMMTLSLARELAPSVRVNGVAPGAILWPEHESGGEQQAEILIKAMINAAKADGHIDEQETERLVGKIREDGVSEEEQRFVMEELRKLDHVAYVRFASVYRSFEDVNAFREEIDKLEKQPTPEVRRKQLDLLGGDED